MNRGFLCFTWPCILYSICDLHLVFLLSIMLQELWLWVEYYWIIGLRLSLLANELLIQRFFYIFADIDKSWLSTHSRPLDQRSWFSVWNWPAGFSIPFAVVYNLSRTIHPPGWVWLTCMDLHSKEVHLHTEPNICHNIEWSSVRDTLKNLIISHRMQNHVLFFWEMKEMQKF